MPQRHQLGEPDVVLGRDGLNGVVPAGTLVPVSDAGPRGQDPGLPACLAALGRRRGQVVPRCDGCGYHDGFAHDHPLGGPDVGAHLRLFAGGASERASGAATARDPPELRVRSREVSHAAPDRCGNELVSSNFGPVPRRPGCHHRPRVVRATMPSHGGLPGGHDPLLRPGGVDRTPRPPGRRCVRRVQPSSHGRPGPGDRRAQRPEHRERR